jgi:hypothetical protein
MEDCREEVVSLVTWILSRYALFCDLHGLKESGVGLMGLTFLTFALDGPYSVGVAAVMRLACDLLYMASLDSDTNNFVYVLHTALDT